MTKPNSMMPGIGGTNPPLPPGVSFGSGMPRAPISGSPESTGNAMGPAIASILKQMGAGGGSAPKGLGSRSGRALEKPSLARSNAIARRLNGNPSRGTELKGL